MKNVLYILAMLEPSPLIYIFAIMIYCKSKLLLKAIALLECFNIILESINLISSGQGVTQKVVV